MEIESKRKMAQGGGQKFKILHCLANHQRRVSYVEEILVDGGSISGNETMREATKSHFQLLYKEEFDQRPKLENICFNIIRESEQVFLESEFTKEEITTCLKDCNRDKAPA